MNVKKMKSGTTVYSYSKDVMSPESVEEGCVCDVVLELSGIWFMQKTFGPVWRIIQIRMKRPPKKVKEPVYLFQDDDEKSDTDDEDDIAAIDRTGLLQCKNITPA